MADFSFTDLDDSVHTRFWSKVERRGENECWPWVGARLRDGRGSIYVAGKHLTASRLSLIMATGQAPGRWVFACHSCDNPNCVNPAHLWWGTHADNMKDASRKGRMVGQDRTHCAKGHEYTPENTVANSGGVGRRCRECRLIEGRRRAIEQREERHRQGRFRGYHPRKAARALQEATNAE